MDKKNQKFQAAMLKLQQQKRKIMTGNIHYWKKQLPQFSITDLPFCANPKHYDIAEKDLDFCLSQLKHDGYFVTPPIIPEEDLAVLRQCIKKVISLGYPPDYAFIYDVFFEIYQKLGQVLTPILGENYQLVPDEFGTYFIETNDSASGTQPHRDSIHTHEGVVYKDDLPTLINIWIPLTDTNSINSCMYLIPLSVDPLWKDKKPIQKTTFSLIEVNQLLHSARAIPAKAGSILGWDTNILHWGGKSSQFAKNPRMSIAMYLQSASVPPYHKFTMDIPNPIPFDYRLYLIEKIRKDRALSNNNFRAYQKLWYDYHEKKLNTP